MIAEIMIIFLTFGVLIAAHHTMVLAHEWSHSAVAWAFGLKPSPFAIHYGDWTLFHADEDIDYAPIFDSAQPWRASLIAGAALLTNALLYLASLTALQAQYASLHKSLLLILLAFWFGVFNIAQLYSYLPLRAFSPSGDVGHFARGLRLPGWLCFLVGTPLVVWGLLRLFQWALPLTYAAIGLKSAASQIFYAALTVAVVFGLYGAAPLFYYGLRDRRSLWSIFSLGAGVLALSILVRRILSNS